MTEGDQYTHGHASCHSCGSRKQESRKKRGQMRRQQPLLKRVLRFIQEHELVRVDEPLIVGVSGGPDSVCLLHILAGLKRALGMKLNIAHLNHLLRHLHL